MYYIDCYVSRRAIYILTMSLFGSAAYGQNGIVSFDKIIASFENSWRDPLLGWVNDSANNASLYRTKEFNVSISEKPIAFDTVHVVVNNPYYTEEFDDYDDNYINYPVSFSVIYDERLVSLFGNGKFVCHRLDDIQRDFDLEKKLNTKRFKYHWIIDNQLAAVSGGRIYTWKGDKWTILKIRLPFRRQPKLFEDGEFMVFSDCFGEFGGTVYFFERETGDIFTEATCANSVWRVQGRYFVIKS